MAKKVVIIGSASLQEKIQWWKSWWEGQGLEVTAYPAPVPQETFLKEYPKVHTDFFASLEEADLVFVMNEDKNGVPGYIGAESFAEMAFAVAQNLVHDKRIDVLLLRMPDKSVQSYAEVELWLKLGWIRLLHS
jgi:hypothetical protein